MSIRRVVGCIVLLLVVSSGRVDAISDDKAAQASLVGIDKFRVEVKLAEDIDDFGVSASEPLSRVELRLRQSGIQTSADPTGFLASASIGPSTSPILRVTVSALDGGNSAPSFFVVTLDLRQLVNVEHSTSSQYAATWARSELGTSTRGGLNRGIKSVLNDLLDEFIDDYLAANPRQQQAPK